MISRLLPPRADNAYRGHKSALWLFGLKRTVNSELKETNGIGFACY
jgi:hypothetical protein